MNVGSICTVGTLIASEGLDPLMKKEAPLYLRRLSFVVGNIAVSLLEKVIKSPQLISQFKQQVSHFKDDFENLKKGLLPKPSNSSYYALESPEEQITSRTRACIKAQALPWIEAALLNMKEVESIQKELQKEFSFFTQLIFDLLDPSQPVSCSLDDLVRLKSFLISQTCFIWHRNNQTDLQTWEGAIVAWEQKLQSSSNTCMVSRLQTVIATLKELSCVKENINKKQTYEFGVEEEEPFDDNSSTPSFHAFVCSMSTEKLFPSEVRCKSHQELVNAINKIFYTNDSVRLLALLYNDKLQHLVQQSASIDAFMASSARELQPIAELMNREITRSLSLVLATVSGSIPRLAKSINPLFKEGLSIFEFREKTEKIADFAVNSHLAGFRELLAACCAFVSFYQSIELYPLFTLYVKKEQKQEKYEEWDLFKVLYSATEKQRQQIRESYNSIKPTAQAFIALSSLEGEYNFDIPDNEKLSYAISFQKIKEAERQSFYALYKLYSQFAEKNFTSQCPEKRLQFLLKGTITNTQEAVLSQYVQGTEESTYPEEKYLEALNNYVKTKSLIPSLIEQLAGLLGVSLTLDDAMHIFLNCRKTSPKASTVEDKRGAISLVDNAVKKYSLPPYQRLMIALEMLYESDTPNAISIHQHLQFLLEFEKFLTFSLPPAIVFSCLVYHDLDKKRVRFISELSKLRQYELLNQAKLEHIHEEVTRFIAPIDMPKQIPGADAEYKIALGNFALFATCNYGVDETLKEITPPLFCPRGLPFALEPKSSLFVSAATDYHQYTPAFTSRWSLDEKGYYSYHLSIMKNPLSLETSSKLFALEISKADLEKIHTHHIFEYGFLQNLLYLCSSDKFMALTDKEELDHKSKQKPEEEYEYHIFRLYSLIGTKRQEEETLLSAFNEFRKKSKYGQEIYKFAKALRAHIQETLVSFSTGKPPITPRTETLQKEALHGNIHFFNDDAGLPVLSLLTKDRWKRADDKAKCFSFTDFEKMINKDTISKSSFEFKIPLFFLQKRDAVQRRDAICKGARSEDDLTVEIWIPDLQVSHIVHYPLMQTDEVLQKDESGKEELVSKKNPIWTESDLCSFIVWQTLIIQSRGYSIDPSRPLNLPTLTPRRLHQRSLTDLAKSTSTLKIKD